MGFTNMMMAACKSIPKSTMTQSIPSLTYSSCSTTNMWWLKNCCSFSLTKLMEICSNPLYSKISKPAISKTAQKLAFLREASIRVSLHLTISHLKRRSKMALAIPAVAPVACSTECGHLSSKGVWGDLLQLSLVITTLLDVDNTSSSHDTSSQHVAVELLLLRETENVEGILSVLKLLIVINGSNSGLTLGDIDIVVDVR